MKGVSTIIATLLMLIITIALAGLAYSYISGLFASRTGKVIDIDTGATFCSGTTITVYVKNEGTIDFNANAVNIQKQGQTAKTCTSASATVIAGGSTVACTNTLAATDGVTAGNNIIVVGGASSAGPTNTVRANVFCPG